jgi:hypothetical protein
LLSLYLPQESEEDGEAGESGDDDYEDGAVGDKRRAKAKRDKAPAKKTPKIWTVKGNTFYIEKCDEESAVATLSNGVELTLEKGENPEEAIDKISQMLPAMLIPKK